MAEVYGNTISGSYNGFALSNGKAKLTYTTSSTATAVTVTLTLSFSIIGSTTQGPSQPSRSINMSVSGSTGGYSGSGTVTLTVPNNQTTSVRTFNAGGGVTLVSSKTVTYTKTTAAQTKTISFSVTNSSISKTSSGSISIAVPALASYTVSYNANGGTNAPASQTKYYNTALTLKGAPSRSGYTFKGWSTSQDRANHKNSDQQPDQIDYASGGSYTGNAALTLYAAWEKNYIKPYITSVTVERCDSNGKLDDEGKYAKVTFDWAVDTTKHSGNTVGSLTVQIGTVSSTRTVTGTSGHESFVMGNDNFDTDKTYPVTITLTDTCVEAATTTWVGELALARFPLDIFVDETNGYMAVGLCRPAPEGMSGVFLGDDTYIDGDEYIYVDDTAGSGTTDYEIITALGTLGWATDCLIDI